MEEHCNNLKAAVYLCLFRQESGKQEILLQRRQNTGYMDGMYDFVVSGHVDEGESLEQALIREAREEAGIGLSANDLEYLMLFDEFSSGYLKVFFRAKSYTGVPQVMEPDKCSEQLWTDVDNLPQEIIPYLPEVLRNIKLGIKCDDENFSVQKRYKG